MKKTRLVLVLVLFVLLFSVFPRSATAQISTPVCPADPSVSTLLSNINQDSVTKWIRDFSGADSVIISGTPRYILTRYSSQLFNSNTNALAYVYLHQQLLNLRYEQGTTLTDHMYSSLYFTLGSDEMVRDLPSVDGLEQVASWRNKVVTIPGHGPNADEIVLLTAHLDSTSNAPTTNAPGAEDNASGIAALMESARLFRFYQFDRTIKIIFFTGEEQGLWGSEAYVADHPVEMSNIVGVVNLDMFGYDNNHDGCTELHVGTLPDSNIVGTCFTDVNSNYNLGLSFDYLTTNGEEYSDHASFWDAGVGAIEVLENYSSLTSANGCGAIADRNPHYHKTTDTIDKMYIPTTLSIVKAGVGTTASLAGPMGTCFAADPQLVAVPQTDSILLSWPELTGADVYNVYRSTTSCDGDFSPIAQVSTNSYLDTAIVLDTDYFYKVEAAESSAVCFSQLSNCAIARVEEPVFFDTFIPLVIAGD